MTDTAESEARQRYRTMDKIVVKAQDENDG